MAERAPLRRVREVWHNVLRRRTRHGDIVDVFGIIIGCRLAGEMDVDDEAMIRAWIKIHREELVANWKLLTEEGTYFKIEPLR